MKNAWALSVPVVHALVFLAPLLFPNAGRTESVNIGLTDVPQLQDDLWSCGIQSAYRILRGGFGQPVDYVAMRSTVTSFNPMRVVLIEGVVEFDLNFLGIGGEPTNYLANSLRANYRPSAASQSASAEQIKDLLWSGKPLMMLEQVGVKGAFGDSCKLEGCLGIDFGSGCWGQEWSVNVCYPDLHWEVAVGYNDSYLYFKGTRSNVLYQYRWEDIERLRSWTLAPYSREVADVIQRNGARPFDIIYFDEPLPPSIPISRTGERFPTITTTVRGTGHGTVASSLGTGCTDTCSAQVRNGTQVSLTASPAPGSLFRGWEGPCSGTGECSVTVTRTETVLARFDSPAVDTALAVVTGLLLDEARGSQSTLSVSTSGAGVGRITSNPLGIDCGTKCTGDFLHGSVVQLTAAPDPDSRLSMWSGACGGVENTCDVLMDAERVATAHFDKAPVTTARLKVTKGGGGAGLVTSGGGEVSCGPLCIASLISGSEAHITATPAPDSAFLGWEGACSGLAPACTVAMDGDKVVTANFSVQLDSDRDGAPDIEDNCMLVPNADQRDTDNDGYGNMCDGDLNNDGVTNTLDLNAYKQAHRSRSGDPNYNANADFNGDGQINTLDLNIYKSFHRKPPGPSGLVP